MCDGCVGISALYVTGNHIFCIEFNFVNEVHPNEDRVKDHTTIGPGSDVRLPAGLGGLQPVRAHHRGARALRDGRRQIANRWRGQAPQLIFVFSKQENKLQIIFIVSSMKISVQVGQAPNLDYLKSSNMEGAKPKLAVSVAQNTSAAAIHNYSTAFYQVSHITLLLNFPTNVSHFFNFVILLGPELPSGV